ncbi:hypothetical protein [Sulfuricurvum sp.]|uniref:hypothetical protein n=1 Tax=Sulfuricurvum sp. TaxID=2025608 RepID=UPI00262D4236|nr:hypothetical protein [Sulfuricurvum sp.]MDD3597749.1 hypothetical protein [Sulfuricurvum sp.]
MTPHITIFYEEDFSKSIFDEFVDTLSSDNLSIQVLSREKSGPFAGVEWLLPTAVIAYISKSYFDGFLNEMGKDHYNIVKKGFLSLKENLVGSNAPKINLVTSSFSKNKVNNENPYSFVFSIMSDANDNKKFKLLIKKDISDDEYNKTIDSFLEFLQKYHNETLNDEIRAEIKQNTFANTTLVAFNPKTNELIFVNPIPQRKKV